jgi:hydrogenase expression/formation protein HypD
MRMNDMAWHGMKYIEEYRDKELILKLSDHIKKSVTRNYAFMEVCGGHTSAIHRFGIPSLLPPEITLISGPGCPVCVTATDFIDKAVAYSQLENVTIVTFGDLIRVPGSSSSLEKEIARGADVRIVFSGLEALNIARSEPGRKIIFLGIGFETTAPGTAATVRTAKGEGLKNFLLLSAHKTMPPVMETIVGEGIKIDGFICPGHVAAIMGSGIFEFLPVKYNLGCVIAGFEPTDILQSILMLVRQINNNSPDIEIQYTRAVTKDGNLIAQDQMHKVFEHCDVHWRGFGNVPASGLRLKREFEEFDAEKRIPLNLKKYRDNPSCICGDILRGLRKPENCSLFRNKCAPENPVGACMVSAEGACNTYFKYHSK